MKKFYNQPLVEVNILEAKTSLCQAASPAGVPESTGLMIDPAAAGSEIWGN